MVELMGLELNVSARDVDAGVAVELGGSDRKLLLHKDGELISALQFLLNRMARRAWPEAGRIHLSCDGDRKRRDEDLVEQAREAAQQVVRTGKTTRLQPMNAYERQAGPHHGARIPRAGLPFRGQRLSQAGPHLRAEVAAGLAGAQRRCTSGRRVALNAAASENSASRSTAYSGPSRSARKPTDPPSSRSSPMIVLLTAT